MRILVTGASGLLGLNLCLMQSTMHHVVGIVNQTRLSGLPFSVLHADLTQEADIKRVLDESAPDLVINCAAMADMDRCESQPDLAACINTWMPGMLAGLCARKNADFIHISTDAVFDGKTGDYSETDIPNPLSMYAQTKLAGEQQVQECYPRALIARVNFYGYSITGKRSLAEFFLYNLIAGSRVNGFTDVIFSPLYVKDLIAVLFEMHANHLSGLYHVVSAENMSKFDFGCAIARRFSLNEGFINPISYKHAGLKAQRSPNLFLNIDKLLSAGVHVPAIAQGIDNFYRDFQAELPQQITSYMV